MQKADLQKLLAREPFVPFRIHLKNGKTFDVQFADTARVLSSEVLIFIGLKQGTRRAKSYDSFPFDHVDRIEERPSRTRRQRKAS